MPCGCSIISSRPEPGPEDATVSIEATRGDITVEPVDAIVNAANGSLLYLVSGRKPS